MTCKKESFTFYVESAHRIKTIDSMWYFQCMSFCVETLHQFNNFFGRVWLRWGIHVKHQAYNITSNAVNIIKDSLSNAQANCLQLFSVCFSCFSSNGCGWPSVFPMSCLSVSFWELFLLKLLWNLSWTFFAHGRRVERMRTTWKMKRCLDCYHIAWWNQTFKELPVFILLKILPVVASSKFQLIILFYLLICAKNYLL